MKVLSHLRTQPFLAAVSLAAALHSSWSFSTLFTGLEPHPQFTPSWFAWIIPGVMLAFSVDIGLLTLANQIRLGQRTKGKLLAFAVLCGAMGFLQFLYIAAHMPEVALGAGVRSEWIGLVSLLRDASIWILPLLLPTALTLFAFSESAPERTATPSSAMALVPQDSVEPMIIETPGAAFVDIQCEQCEWGGSYDTSRKAQNALTAHRRTHKIAVRSNGKHN